MSFPRYESYKDSGVEWLGNVPEHWQTMQFKRLASIQNGRDYKHIETNGNDGYPVIGSGGEFARATEYLFTGESVLLGRKGTIDKPLYINGSFWVVDTMFYTIVNKKAVPKYLYYCALTIRFDLYSTSTAVPSMTQNDLGSIYFAIPDIAEQQTIAAFLDRETAKIDTLIAEQQRLIELLKEKRQSVISHAVTKGLNPNAPMKDSGIEWLGEVPEHWGLPKLKHFTSFAGGGTPSRDNIEYWNGNIPWVSPKDMKVEIINSAEEYITQTGLENSSSSLRPSGQVLMVVRSGILKHTIPVAITEVPVALNQDMKALSFTDGSCLNLFFMRWTQGLNDLLLLAWAKQGATVESIEQTYLAETVIPLPPIPEQQTIIAFLERETTKFDTLTTEAKTAISLLQERRTALISAAVTGKIDVRKF
jgi:type I restriction enzyme, S subunit